MDLSPSDSIALSSLVVAGCAIAISVWQGYLTRKHNILSVRPHVDIVLKAANGEAHFQLENWGLGPAFIEAILLESDDGPPKTAAADTYVEVFSTILKTTQCQATSLGPDCALGAGESLSLLHFFDSDDAKNLHLDIKRCMSGRSLRIVYTCMYGNRFETAYTPKVFEASLRHPSAAKVRIGR